MCSRAVWTVLPCGSSTAFLGVMIIFAFMRNGGFSREKSAVMVGKGGERSELFWWQGRRCCRRFKPPPDQTCLEPNNTSDTDSDMRSESAFESRVSDTGIEARE